MSIRQFKDWRAWFEGLANTAVRSGALAASSSMTTWMGSNAIATLPFEFLKNAGMSWKTALVQLGATFAIHAGSAIFKYLSDRNLGVVEQEVNSNPSAFVKPTDEP